MSNKEKTMYVESRTSKNGKPYVALVCDFGYRKAIVSLDASLIAEISGKSFADIYALQDGEVITVARF